MTTEYELTVCMIVKNEAARIHITFDSVMPHVDAAIVIDTGSEDNTMQVITELCRKHNKPLHMTQVPFVNFEVTRNELLLYANELTRWMLLFDAHDELLHPETLRSQLDEKYDIMHVKQQWYFGTSSTNYNNTRLVHTRRGHLYKYPVHEVIMRYSDNELKNYFGNRVYKLEQRNDETQLGYIKDVVIYQDRTKDDDKSLKRLPRDRDMLVQYLRKHNNDPRATFYLADTYFGLLDYKNAIKYYRKRYNNSEGFYEEIYLSLMKCANCHKHLGQHHEALELYERAWNDFKRAEPLIDIALHYASKEDFWNAYMRASTACKVPYPHHHISFVDNELYRYKRWNVLGIIAYYVGQYEEGLDAVNKALDAHPDSQLDNYNKEFYVKKIKELKSSV